MLFNYFPPLYIVVKESRPILIQVYEYSLLYFMNNVKIVSVQEKRLEIS